MLHNFCQVMSCGEKTLLAWFITSIGTKKVLLWDKLRIKALRSNHPEHVSGAERREFPLPAFVGVRCFAPSLKVIPDSSAHRPLPAHLKFHSAPVKSLHACSNSWEAAIPNVFHRISLGHTARCGLNWHAVALLLGREPVDWNPFQFVKNGRLFWAVTSSSFCVLSVWASGWPCTASGIGTELERNGTIALAFGLKPALRSDCISHAPLPARSALMPCKHHHVNRLHHKDRENATWSKV